MLKVVVVEDEDLVRKGIVLAVDWASVDCVVVGEAANGLDGLDVIDHYQPDLVITDIKMPKMDGLEMIRRLRLRGNEAHVIILTAYSDFSYAQTALKLHAVDYLLKPFHDGELEETIRKLQQQKVIVSSQPAQEIPVLDPRDGGHSKYVMDTLLYISDHYSDADISVTSIARDLGVSESHLSHVFKKETSYTLVAYLTNCRMHNAMELLKDPRNKIYEVAEQVGYRDITYFSAAFKRVVGISPSTYQRQC